MVGTRSVSYGDMERVPGSRMLVLVLVLMLMLMLMLMKKMDINYRAENDRAQ